MKTQFKRDNTQNSTKLHLDQYYTPTRVAVYCIETAYKVIGRENITSVLEPSAGTGSFSNNVVDCEAYDLEPKADGVVQADFLLLDIGYKKGRLVIGNRF
jgi:predicted RNA methylase